MSPGSINRLISSSAIAFRVKFENKIPPHVNATGAARFYLSMMAKPGGAVTHRIRRRPTFNIAKTANTLLTTE